MHSPEPAVPESFEAEMALMRSQGDGLYSELVKLARAQLNRNDTVSLDAPSVVHEAYLRFAQQSALNGMRRNVFFAYAAKVMCTVIIDHLRERGAEKRGGNQPLFTLSTGIPGTTLGEDELNQLHDGLRLLEKIDPRAHRVVEMRYFAGLTEEEIADLLHVSVPTIKRDWRKARAFLFDAIAKSIA